MLEKYARLNEAIGVSVHIGADGARIWGFCRIEVKNEQLSIVGKKYGITEKELLDQLKPGLPVALNISGKGILNKYLTKIPEINKATLSQILPNAEPGDFYLQNFVSGAFSFVSVIRKTEAEKLLEVLTARNLPVLMLTMGPFPVYQVVNQLNFYDGEIFAGHYRISRNESGEWLELLENKEEARPSSPVILAAENFDHRLLPAYASAFQLVLNENVDAIESNYQEGIDRREHFLEQRKLRTYSALVLAVCFVVLLINFLLFTSLNSSNSQLSDQADRSARTTSNLDQLSHEVSSEQALLQTLGWDGGKSKARMADRMAALMPGNISLSELGVQPPDAAAARLQRNLQFRSNVITASGTCDRVVPVNEWIARLKAQKWVKDVSLDSYTFDPEKNTGRFTLWLSY